MRQQWHISDFLDLEYFFIQDRKLAEEKGEGILRDRDRSPVSYTHLTLPTICSV